MLRACHTSTLGLTHGSGITALDMVVMDMAVSGLVGLWASVGDLHTSVLVGALLSTAMDVGVDTLMRAGAIIPGDIRTMDTAIIIMVETDIL